MQFAKQWRAGFESNRIRSYDAATGFESRPDLLPMSRVSGSQEEFLSTDFIGGIAWEIHSSGNRRFQRQASSASVDNTAIVISST